MPSSLSGALEPINTSSQEANCWYSETLWASYETIGSLKLAIEGVFIPQKSANATNYVFPPTESRWTSLLLYLLISWESSSLQTWT